MGLNSRSFQQIRFQPDSGQLTTASITLTLGAADSITIVEIPNWANGFRVYPSGTIRFAVGRNPTVATSSNASVSESELGVGGFARGNVWEVRILNPSPGNDLHIMSIAGGETVDLEYF